ncbi:3169_t:CDS:1, partial [Gigaspora margarita]
FKLLESEDLLSILFRGIYIWTANTDEGINLLHYRKFDRYDLEPENSYFLKSPRFGRILKNMNKNAFMYKTIGTNEKYFKYDDLLKYYIKDLQIIKLYGNDLMKGLIEYQKNTYYIKKLFAFCLEQSLLQLKYGYLTTFIELIDIITSSLLELEQIDKSFDFTKRFLSKTALLISDDFKEDFLENNSSISHFEN